MRKIDAAALARIILGSYEIAVDGKDIEKERVIEILELCGSIDDIEILTDEILEHIEPTVQYHHGCRLYRYKKGD